MKSNVSSTQSSESPNRRDIVVFSVALFGSFLIPTLLCEMGLHSLVLLSALAISIGNAIYYGIVWKGLQKSFRIGLAILFSIVALIGVMLYRSFLHTDKVSQLDFPVELFGGFVVMLTVVFIYKHQTPSFWNWV